MCNVENIAVVVLGCPKNEVDAEVLSGELTKNSFNITDNVDSAGIVVIFTCGFIQDAVEESIDTILKYTLDKKVFVVGCLINRYGKETLKKLIPEVEEFFDTYNYLEIISYLKSEKKFEKNNQFIYSAFHNRILFNNNFAYIKISEGCNNKCSFCSIPSIKGKLFSRKQEDIIDEIKKIVDNGIYEIILISQNNADYGKDLKDASNLYRLIEKILKINHLKWLRLLYLYPDNITEEFLNLTKHEKFCNYLDIPVQHIDNDLLKKMNRKISERKLRHLFDKIKTDYPNIFLRTSLIVGFPGEDDIKFQKLLEFIKEYKFYNLGCFIYSKEENTRASKMNNQINKKMKISRYHKLMELQKTIINNINKSLIGKDFLVNISGFSEETELLLEGRTEFQSPDIDGKMLINKGEIDSIGFYNVRITDFADYDLIGEIKI